MAECRISKHLGSGAVLYDIGPTLKQLFFILGHSNTILAVESSEGDEDEVFQRLLDNYKAERGVALISESESESSFI